MAANSPPTIAPTRRGDSASILLMMAAATVAIAGFGLLFSLWWRSDVADDYEVLRVASQEFVAGRPAVAGELAETVRFPEDNAAVSIGPEDPAQQAAADPVPLSEAEKAAQAERQNWIRLRDFLVGAGKVAQAQQEGDSRERRRLLLEAIPTLEKARDAGFPPGRQTHGYQILGESLFQLGHYQDAIVALNQAIALDPTLRRELLPQLAESQLRTAGPAMAQSLVTIDGFLGDTTLQSRQLWAGQLIRIRALIELEKWREATAAIDAALQSEPLDELTFQDEQAHFHDQLTLLQAIARIRQAIRRHGAYPNDIYEDRSRVIAELANTMESLTSLQREADPQTAAQARLWAARALLTQGLYDDALTQLTAVRQMRPFGAEGTLGGLEEIELLARQGRGVEMLQTTRYMMREIGDPSGFDAGLITLESFQQRLTDALDQLRQSGDYANAIDTARSLPPVFETSEALMQEAIGYSQWAVATLADGTDLSGEVARSAAVLARSRYRAAGDAYAEAAKLLFSTEQYLPAQWAAIDAYQKGRHFRRSIRLLEPYLRYEERRRQPRGLVAYGRALLAEGDPDMAIEALKACIVEFPRDPLRYDARLLVAMAYAEKDDLDRARLYLTENLQDGELTPQSPAWRDSLFSLGELLYDRSYRNHLAALRAKEQEKVALLRQNHPLLEESIRYLNESVQRYWPAPRAESAAYLAARAHVLASQWPRIESNSPEILDAAKRTLRAQADQQLQLALEAFANLRKHLATREEEMRLPIKEQTILRNCFLAEADMLREMSRLEEAFNAYRTVELRYMNEPPALEAILGRARCAKQLGRTREADLLYRQASVVLERIPEEWNDKFAEMTRYDREGWKKYLTWMNDRITNQGA